MNIISRYDKIIQIKRLPCRILGVIMRITKVNGYRMANNTYKGYIVDKDKNEIISIKDITHVHDSISNKFRRILDKGVKKSIDNTKDTDHTFIQINEINKKRKAIENIISCFILECDNFIIRDNDFNSKLKMLKDCTFEDEDRNGKNITKSDIISFSLRQELINFEFHKIIAEMIENTCVNNEICSKIIIRHCKPICNFIFKEKNKLNKTTKSIDNNNIQYENSNNKISDFKKFKDRLSKTLYNGESDFNIIIDKLEQDYDVENLVEQLRLLQDSDCYKNAYNTYRKNSLIKKDLIKFQLEGNIKAARENRTDLRFYDKEVVNYFHKYFPVKNKSYTHTNNDDSSDKINAERIKREVRAKLKNKAVNNSIREGALIEYDKNNKKDLSNITNKEIEIMHIEDVFSRKLSSIITYSANNFRNELFGEYSIELLKSKKIKFLGIFFEKEHLSNVINLFKNSSEKLKNELIKLKKYGCFINEIDSLCSDMGNTSHIDKLMRIYSFYSGKNDNIISTENAINNILQNDDILTNRKIRKKNNILSCYEENNMLSRFINYSKPNDIYEFCRNSIYAFRNTAFHYKNKIELDFLCGKDDEIKYLKDDLNKRIGDIPKFEIEKAYSNAVFSYWDMNTIFDFYNKQNLYIPRDNQKMPNFRRVLKSYEGILKHNHKNPNNKLIENEDIANSLFSLYKSSNSSQQAKRYLFMKIYYVKADEIRRKILDNLSSYNDTKLAHKNIKYSNTRNFSTILENEVSVSHIYQEFRKVVQRDKQIAIEDLGKESGYIFDIENELAAIAFIDIISKPEYKFIFESSDINNPDLDKVVDEFMNNHNSGINLSNIKPNVVTDDLLYSFYSILIFLSKSRLSELNNNIISYNQACDDFGLDKKIYGNIDIEDALKIIKIMMYTYEYTDIDDIHYEFILKKFLPYENINELKKYNVKLEDRDQLYIQNDGITPVQFRQIIEAYKEDLLGRYDEYYSNKGITIEEAAEYERLSKIIEDNIKRIDELKNKNKLSDFEKNKYTELYIEKQKHDSLRNRLLFNDVSKMNRLLVDLYSRLNGIIAVCEKDLYHLYYKFNPCFVPDKNTNIFMKIQEDSRFKNFIKYNTDSSDKGSEIFFRNKFAHFEFMRNDNEVKDINILEQLNGLRKLLRVDRKLKNAVTKIIINVFDKHGFDISFRFENHQIAAYNIIRKQLNDDRILTHKIEGIKNRMKYRDYFLEMIEDVIFSGAEKDSSIHPVKHSMIGNSKKKNVNQIKNDKKT